MKATEREQIREAISQHALARVKARHNRSCIGCGGDYSNHTRGCKQCWDRHLRRRRRA